MLQILKFATDLLEEEKVREAETKGNVALSKRQRLTCTVGFKTLVQVSYFNLSVCFFFHSFLKSLIKHLLSICPVY
jgi:hypothetical protein